MNTVIKSTFKPLSSWFATIALKERCSRKIALSFCIGNYIAFSPFIGLHFAMAVLFARLFSLNFPITFAVAYGVNNPFTAVPIYLTDYIFGHWLLHKMLSLNVAALSPLWFEKISQNCSSFLGTQAPCVWSFLIGGNILALVISLALYPFINSWAQRIMHAPQPPSITLNLPLKEDLP